MNKVIYHIDVNSAFLSWEACYRLEHLNATVDLRDQVSAVGGDIAKRHGIILAKSIPSKIYNIKTGESIMEAKQKCPHIILVPPHYQLYEQCSAAFIAILKNYTPHVEQYSIDEAYLDMTGTEKLWGNSIQAAFNIKNHIYNELGFTVNVGISSNKLLAKMASDFKKPDRVHTLFPEEIKVKMWPLPVGDLFFVGRATVKKLHKLGIYTIGQLALADPDILRLHMKKHGEVIWHFANGRDVSVVESDRPANKGYGNSTTIAFDVTDINTAKLVLLALSEKVATRLRADNVKAEVISIGIKTHDFSYAGHQLTLRNATNITIEIHKYACQLFDQLWDGSPIRHLGIFTSRIKEKENMRQINMFDDTDYEKLEILDSTVDAIRTRYGRDSIMRLAFLGGKINHISGGISKEKQTVDYNKIEVL